MKGSFGGIATSEWALIAASADVSPFKSNDQRILNSSSVSQREETSTSLMVG